MSAQLYGRTAAALRALEVAQQTLDTVGFGANFELTPKGLVVKGKPSYELSEQFYEELITMSKCIQFAIGDMARYIRERWPDKADQILSARTGWTDETQRNYEWTSEKVSPAVRRLDVLSFTHHQKVARLPPAEQKKWLDRAAEGEEKNGTPTPWTVSRLSKAIKAGADLPVTAWIIIASCKSEAQRDRMVQYLESEGIACKTGERRGEPA